MITIPLQIDGKVYNIAGIGKIRLFPISKIAQALTDMNIPRDTQTIRKWEIRGIIPPTIFRGGKKRLYSKEQIECIVRIAVECNIKKGKTLLETNFSERIWEELEPINEKYKKRLRGENK